MTTPRQTVTTEPPRRRTSSQVLVVAGVAALMLLGALLVALLRHEVSVSTGSPTTRGSGVTVSEPRTVPPFTRVELAGSNNVSVQVGAARSVVVHGDDNLVGHIHTTVRSGALVIETTGSFSTRAPMRVTVTVPDLTSATLSGSGNLVVDGVHAPSFAAGLTGSGTMLVSGRTSHLDATLPGSGVMMLHGLVAQAAAVQLSGSGDVQVYATRSLRAEVAGSGSVTYAGDPPQVSSTVTGSGTVQPS